MDIFSHRADHRQTVSQRRREPALACSGQTPLLTGYTGALIPWSTADVCLDDRRHKRSYAAWCTATRPPPRYQLLPRWPPDEEWPRSTVSEQTPCDVPGGAGWDIESLPATVRRELDGTGRNGVSGTCPRLAWRNRRCRTPPQVAVGRRRPRRRTGWRQHRRSSVSPRRANSMRFTWVPIGPQKRRFNCVGSAGPRFRCGFAGPDRRACRVRGPPWHAISSRESFRSRS